MVSASNQILLDLYGCAEDPQRWGQVLDGICREFKVRSAVAQVFQRDGFKLHQRWTVRDTFSSLHAERHDALVNNDRNPRTDLRVVSRPRNDMIYRDEDIFAENCPHFARLRSRLSASAGSRDRKRSVLQRRRRAPPTRRPLGGRTRRADNPRASRRCDTCRERRRESRRRPVRR